MSDSHHPLRHSVFICYAREDLKFLEELQKHLSGLLKPLGFEVRWDDTELQAGDEWRSKIDQMLGQARLAVVLLSPNSVDSEFIRDVELPRLLQRRKAGEVTIIPLLVSPVSLKKSVFEHLQIANPDKPLRGRPIPERDLIYAKISEDIVERLEALAPAANDNSLGAAPPATADSPADQDADVRLQEHGEWVCCVPEAMALDQIEEALRRLKRLTRTVGFVTLSYDRFYVQFFYPHRTEAPQIEMEVGSVAVGSDTALSPDGEPVLSPFVVQSLKKKGFEQFQGDGNLLMSAPFADARIKALAKLAWEVLKEYFPIRKASILDIQSQCR